MRTARCRAERVLVSPNTGLQQVHGPAGIGGKQTLSEPLPNGALYEYAPLRIERAALFALSHNAPGAKCGRQSDG